jgi:predicted RNA-binding protein with PIN domain
VFEDSPEAATHLVRAPGSHLVVDGYNVTFTSWPAIPDLPSLRHRLVTALSELAVRLQRPVTVVFDGADEGNRVAAPAAARQWLTIMFSASSVEADEVIVHTVAQLPPHVPVVVATNDKQIRSDARRLGANVISVEQLLSVLGRHPVR